MILEAIVLSATFVLFLILGRELAGRLERYHIDLLSFGAGLLVTTLLLDVLPQLSKGQQFVDGYVYVALALGFVSIHIIEKVIQQRSDAEGQGVEAESGFREFGLNVFEFLAGLTIPLFLKSYGNLTILVFIPFLVRIFAMSISLVHERETRTVRTSRTVAVILPLTGTLIGLILVTNEQLLYVILASSMGIILYIAVRDIIPPGRSGRPLFFAGGAAIAFLFFFFVNSIA